MFLFKFKLFLNIFRETVSEVGAEAIFKHLLPITLVLLPQDTQKSAVDGFVDQLLDLTLGRRETASYLVEDGLVHRVVKVDDALNVYLFNQNVLEDIKAFLFLVKLDILF